MKTITNLLSYQITEQLYGGTRTLVYRGIRTSDKYPVVIKLLRNEYPNFNELIGFRNQYTIAKNIDFPSIIKPLSLEVYHNSYALVMEDFGGISLSTYLKLESDRKQPYHSLDLTEFLKLALQLADILDYLYQNRVIHKDIKPANILINPETKQIKLIDFSISSLLPRETQEIQNANALEGTLAYLSPEQTGRMNRGVDYRSDFYSLGVTFYELLTGELPFVSDNPMELVHCHLAKTPRSVHEINPDIPLVLSEIISKLMAKNAENRYQNALGIKHDLEICLEQFQATGSIGAFAIGQRDLSDRFIIPEKLYGREKEVQALLNAFDLVSSGNTEMILVAGFSGIGKTAVVNEVHKPIARQRGYFIKGKYDQFQRNIPFSVFVQAFRDLMGQLLSESDRQLNAWKTQILSAVGDNGQVLIDVIPELERIIGKQPAATELSGTAAQNRFNLLIQKFIKVFTNQAHPLVMFIDDLQWADSASLNLLQLLMQDTQYLLILGAYRDNEVSPAHPLILTVDEIVKTGAVVNTITLQPLSLVDLNQLVADTLNCELALAQPLTELVYQKTKGNPFFATQFLKALYEDDYITFDWDIRHWQCDIAQVKALAITDDVVEFMALQLQKLPTQTQDVLKLAACIGAQFDLNTLAIVSEKSPEATADDLWKALQEGLIIPNTEIYKFFLQSDRASVSDTAANPTYRFLHDRVQQAAYSLIPEDRKTATHYHIGQLLLQQIPPEAREERIFELVNQLNYGTSLITQPTAREELAKLNLTACRKARAATAYQAACEYGAVGLSLLEKNAWQEQYPLALALNELAAEVACLNGNFEEMEDSIEAVVQNATSILDCTKVYEAKCLSYIAQNRQPELIATMLPVLEQLGVKFPAESDPSEFETRLAAIKLYLQDRDVRDLVNLPILTIPEKKSAIGILAKIWPASYQVRPDLSPPIVMEQVYLSLRYGNSELSPFAYATFGLILIGVQGDIELGYEFGQLGLKLLRVLNSQVIEARTTVVFYNFVSPWKQHLKDTLQPFLAAYATALETGDLEWAGYGLFNYCSHAYYLGVNLKELEEIIEKHIDFVRSINQEQTINYINVVRHSVLNLLAPSTDAEKLSAKDGEAEVKIREYLERDDFYPLFMTYLQQSTLCYLFGSYDRALDYSLSAEKYVGAVVANIGYSQFYFQDSLTHLARYENFAQLDREATIARVNSNQDKVKKWADSAPMNYLHKFNLVEAEKYRVSGKNYEAADLYDRAISGAKENGYIQEEALANELAAKFYLDWGKEKIAQVYMQDAYYGYARWGAKAKVEDLEKRYPQLLQPILQQRRLNLNPLETITTIARTSISTSTHSSSTNISDALDFASILKAAQAISSSIELDELMTSLTRILLENSGAKKSALILLQNETWQVMAITSVNHQANSEADIQTVLDSQPLDTCQDVPRKIIQYVKNTQKTIIIDRLKTEIPGLIGEYMLAHQPQSVFCTPIVDRGHLVGILYLENQVTSGVFTSDRLQLINLLSSQAAISLENARLYQQSQQAFQDLQHAQLQIVQSEKMSALGNLVAGVAHEINNPVGFISGNIHEAIASFADIKEYLQLYQEKFPDPGDEITEKAEELDIEYLIADFPQMLNSIEVGCDRIKGISTSLRTFSRADKDYKVHFNIHEGIDSTILILKHRLKANEKRPAIEVVTEYGDLPNVECFPGQLNQVFMNIIANAIDALDESNTGRNFEEIQTNPNRITIQTSMADNQVEITIADNGMGMSEEVKQKVFDHLFTTKGVGKGTGLGMAIARQIVVEKHAGVIHVKSIPGEGTEFQIQIPIHSHC